MSGSWVARVVALVLVAVIGSVAWHAGAGFGRSDQRPIWIKPGEYQGPPDATLDPAQVEAINERTQRLKF